MRRNGSQSQQVYDYFGMWSIPANAMYAYCLKTITCFEMGELSFGDWTSPSGFEIALPNICVENHQSINYDKSTKST